MSEKPAISSNFYQQLALILTIVGASIFGFKYLGSLIKDTAREEIKPIVERVIALEEAVKYNRILIIENTDEINSLNISVNSFLDYYNRFYHKEFLRPADINESSIKRKNK